MDDKALKSFLSAAANNITLRLRHIEKRSGKSAGKF